MVIGVIFGFILLLIAMGVASLIGIPVWIVFIALLAAYFVALGVVVYKDSWMYEKRHNRTTH
ncbi:MULTISPECIES: hypothetical protein [Arthrobacter]|uniref:Integral membrane protein n=1 Tax=Arthrobacter terricola TaxID=2547396 RepID=A0A4R5KM82_9MICC|nr:MULTISPECIES: hypothetical protein [Arthrobacter]MBT8161459.1 hypothetical protein [Arthrobacter sp. GN70]TDF95630.1 hypothetical protein E1809_11425 [Arthrobacter terricola]